jgi:hypothetical protein
MLFAQLSFDDSPMTCTASRLVVDDQIIVLMDLSQCRIRAPGLERQHKVRLAVEADLAFSDKR